VTAPSSSLEPVIAFEALLAIWVGFRSYQSYRGRTYSPGRVFVFPILILLVYAATEFETIASVSWSYPTWTLVDLAVLVAAALVTLPLADRLVRVSQRPDGGWFYQYGMELIAIYLALWIIRLGVAAYYDPASLDFAPPVGAPLSATASEAVVLVQGLFSISSGLVIGRSVCTYRLHRKASAQAAGPLPSAP
jgi:hypothetical protein